MKEVTRQTYRERILKVDEYIRAHLDESLDCKLLSQIACFSPYHFHRIFKGMTGENLQEYIRRLKLERAARSLKYGTKTVAMVATEAGYENPESFSRAFQQHFAMTPTQFRNNLYREGLLQPKRNADNDRQDVPAVRITNEAERLVVFLRHTGSYNTVGSTWNALMSWAHAQGVIRQGQPAIGVPHDDPDITPPEKIRYDACLPVASPPTVSGNIGLRSLPGGLHACIQHHGSYQRLGETYSRLFADWLPASQYEARDAPCFEIYRTSPFGGATEGFVTEIYLPLGGQHNTH